MEHIGQVFILLQLLLLVLHLQPQLQPVLPRVQHPVLRQHRHQRVRVLQPVLRQQYSIIYIWQQKLTAQIHI